MAAHHEEQIRNLDRRAGSGSATPLLEHALASLRQAEDPDAELAWWNGAYRMYKWALDNWERWDREINSHPIFESPEEQILHSGEDWTGWRPPPPTPEDLRAWREVEGLTPERAAGIAGVEPTEWAGWESGNDPVPQWLADVLRQRWESAP